MEPYTVTIDKRVVKPIQKFPEKHREQIKKKLLELASTPRPQDCKQLHESGGYRVTVGEYRILYTIDDVAQKIFVYKIVRRNDFSYRNV